ncbi:MAG TPA: lytic murein transglycosylase [Vicinamibacterales bacterium]|nr:lytic murein transglycosylase [Vicinamibacterales bacterium]
MHTSRTVVLVGAAVISLTQLTHGPGADDLRVLAPQVTAAPVQVPSTPATFGVDARQDFPTFVAGLQKDALARGIRQSTVTKALSGLEPSPTVIQRDQTQAENVLTIDQYVDRRLTRAFLRTARQNAIKQKTLLGRVSDTYGVPPRVILSIWGMESNFGRFAGVRPIVQALATLAWEGRRGPFFRGELMNALEIIDRGYIGLDQLRGSWAGAMGQPQFMPSSYLKWAQDFDKDGDRDIWRSEGDVFASIANYLKEHGWTSDLTWGREVKLPAGGVESLRANAGMRAEGCRAEREMTNRLPLARWQELGLRTTDGGALPRVSVDASLIHTGKRAFLVYPNYEALLEYNCAHSYALAVALLSDRVGL